MQTFYNTTTGSPQNESEKQVQNPIPVMHQNPHLDSASDWLKIGVNG